MYRSMLMASVLTTVAFLGATQVQAHDEHSEHFLKCAKVCSSCQVTCDDCFHHCADLVAEGKKEHAKCMHLCVDCAECCKVCATLCARQSALSGYALDCCAKCCEECAAACEKLPDDKHMAACAKECRGCAKTCRDMMKMAKHSAE